MKVRFGVVGMGRIGQRHATVINQLAQCELVGYSNLEPVSVLSPDLYFPHVQDLIEKARPDAICVCSPNGLHARHALQALSHDIHVLCEKPLALHHQEALAMEKAAADRNRYLVCMLQNRYSPHVRWLKDVVSDGALGEIFQVQVNCFWNRDEQYFSGDDGMPHPWHGTDAMDGGPLFTQFSHFVDLLIWLFGDLAVSNPIFRSFRHRASGDIEDGGKFDFSFGQRGFGSFHYAIAVWDRNQESSITLIGSKGSVRLAGQYMDAIDYVHIDGMSTEGVQAAIDAHSPGNNSNNHAFVIGNLASAILGVQSLDFGIGDAVKGVKVIEEVYSQRNL